MEWGVVHPPRPDVTQTAAPLEGVRSRRSVRTHAVHGTQQVVSQQRHGGHAVLGRLRSTPTLAEEGFPRRPHELTFLFCEESLSGTRWPDVKHL